MKKYFISLLGISLSLACSSFGMEKRRIVEDTNQNQLKKSKLEEFEFEESPLALPDEDFLSIVQTALQGNDVISRITLNALRSTSQAFRRLSEDITITPVPKVSKTDLGNEFLNAAKEGNLDLLKFLPLTLLNSTDENGKTALMYAIENHHSEIVDFLLKSHVDKDKVSSSDYTAFLCAIACGDTKIVEKLYNAGASIEALKIKQEGQLPKPTGWIITPLGVACENGLYEMTKWMLEHKKINFKKDINTLTINGKTPLDIVNNLLELCSEDYAEENKETALNNLKDLLVSHGAVMTNNRNNQPNSLVPPIVPKRSNFQREHTPYRSGSTGKRLVYS